MKKIKNYLLKVYKKSLVRFVGVGIIGEILYLILFGIFTSLDFKSTISVLLSGFICIVFNSYLHAKFSFKIAYDFRFLIQYIFIQLICLVTTYMFSFLFVLLRMDNLAIAFSTLVLWGILSFSLINLLINFQEKK